MLDLRRMTELYAKYNAQVEADLRTGTTTLAALMTKHGKIHPDDAVRAEARARALAELRAFKGN